MLSIYKLDSGIYDKPVCILNEGEHIIGRGNLLECDDKRLPTTHAAIKIENGVAAITSMHQNPCFFQSANSKTIIILTRNIPTELKEGDKFGLFPDQFWFQAKFHSRKYLVDNNILKLDKNLTSEINENVSLKRSFDGTDEFQNKVYKLKDGEHVNIVNNAIIAKEYIGDNILNKIPNQKVVTKNITTKEKLSDSKNDHNEKRNINADNNKLVPVFEKQSLNKLFNKELSDSQYDNDNVESKKQANNIANDVCEKPFPNESSLNELSHPKNKEGNLKITINHDSNKSVPTFEKHLSGSSINIVPESKNINDNVEIEEQTSDNTDKGDVECMSAFKKDEFSINLQNINKVTKVFRDRCWYGNNCYRKSLHHKKQFSHPGDSDYDSDPNDMRPTCSYAGECYRKNKDHRREYKHPCVNKRLSSKYEDRKKRHSAKKMKINPDNSEDDYDDPFIDDSEDEYEEESWSECTSDDWEDSNHSDDEDNEDNKTLLREAKRFVKQK